MELFYRRAKQGVEQGEGTKPDRDRAGSPFADAFRHHKRLIQFAQNRLQRRQQGPASGRQPDAMRLPVEKCDAEFILQIRHCLRYRRTRDAQAIGCATKVLFFGRDDKVAKVTKLDIFIHMWTI